MARRIDGYSGLQIGLHWLVLLLVAVQLVFAESMTESVDAVEEGKAIDAATQFGASVHYWVGIAILVVMLARLVVRFRNGAPEHAGDTPPLLAFAASAVHWAFYLVLVAVPISGLAAYYLGGEIGDIHQLARPILLLLIALHVLGALFNQFVRKDGTLMRMVRPAN